MCEHIYLTNYAFAALKAGGSVVSWGSAGEYKSGPKEFRNTYSKIEEQLLDVRSIHAASDGYGGPFAALKADCSVVTWGSSDHFQAARQKAKTANN